LGILKRAKLNYIFMKNHRCGTALTGTKRRTLMSIVVPMNYSQYNGSYEPVYPGPLTSGYYRVDLATVSKAMELISGGDPSKSNYQMNGCDFEILSLDGNLSAYYNATARGQDLFSIKLSETDYSNISGGYGVFGVYMKTTAVSFFNSTYVKNFGYR